MNTPPPGNPPPDAAAPPDPARRELLPWHHRLWQRCLDMRSNDRLSHAFLLHGPRGNGKHAFAARWANALVCRETAPERQPCGRCRGCVLFRAGTHPDVKIIAPASGKKTIGIDRIRGLIDYVWLSRQLADYKVLVIPDAEEMTLPAANTLLKTLEEPPGNAVFLLVSHRIERLPITIRSRCQRLDFPVPPEELVLPWLIRQLPPGPDAEVEAARLLAAAGGAPLLAARYREENTLPGWIEFNEELTGLLAGEIDPLHVAARWQTLGCATVLPWLIGYVMDSIRLHFSSPPDPSGDGGAPAARVASRYARALPPRGDHARAMTGLARALDPRHGYHLFDRCLEARRAWEEAMNSNERLLLEGLAIDFAGTVLPAAWRGSASDL